jgi:hypothetical protein
VPVEQLQQMLLQQKQQQQEQALRQQLQQQVLQLQQQQQLLQQQHSAIEPANQWEAAAVGDWLRDKDAATPTAAAAAAAAAAARQPLGIRLTVADVLKFVSDRDYTLALRHCLMKWARACGFGDDPASAPIAELLPRYNNLLDLLDSQYNSGQLTAKTINQYICSLRILRHHQQEWGGCVDYPAMLSSMDAAWTKYRRLKGVPAAPAPLQAQGTVNSSGAVSNNGTASTLTVGEICSASTTTGLLRSTLKKWAQACTASAGADHSSMLIADLLPHYSRLLDVFDSQHRSGRMAAATAASCLTGLRSFLRSHQSEFERCVDTTAMLSRIGAAADRYHQLTKDANGSSTAATASAAAETQEPLMSQRNGSAAAAAASVAAASSSAAAAASGAAAAAASGAAAAGSYQYVPGVTFAQLRQLMGSRGGCSSGVDMLLRLSHTIPGTTASNAVAPVLLRHTRPELLLAYRLADFAGNATECSRVSSTLHCLLQLLLRPELDAVLGAEVRQQRLDAVRSLCRELIGGLAAHGSSFAAAQQQGGISSRQDLGSGTACEEQQQHQDTGPSVAYEQQQQQQEEEPEGGGLAAAGTSSSCGHVTATPAGPQQSSDWTPASDDGEAAAAAADAECEVGTSAAAASGRSMSMATLLQQLSQQESSSHKAGGAGSHGSFLKLLEESAQVFAGIGPQDIPASLVVTNYIAETGDRAQQCLEAVTTATQQGVGDRVAECSAVVGAVEGLLQLAVQPVVRQLFGPQQLQELIGGLIRCKQQLSYTLSHFRIMCSR